MPHEVRLPRHETQPYSINRLHAIGVLDGRYLDEVAEIEPYASEFALIQGRTEVETRHLVQLSKWGVIRPLEPTESDFLLGFAPNLTDGQAQRVKALESMSDHDVQAVEKMLREYLAGTSMEDLIPYTHLFLTSEDVNNIAYRMMFRRGTDEVAIPSAEAVINKLMSMAKPEEDTVMDARTHGQKAAPTILGKEEIVFAVRLNKEVRKLQKMKLTGKLNGAVGNFNAHMFVRPDIDWQAYAKEFVESFGLEYNPFTTQINPYEDLIEMFQIYQRLNGVFIDLDQDMWRYVSDHWMAQEVVAGETGSSTLAQKVNPIKFENSEGNLTIANGLFETMGRKLGQSRLQRDLSDSTVIRNAPTALAFSLLSYKNTLKGLGRIYPNHPVIDEALHNDWSSLSEGAQSLLRMKGQADAYDKVKAASRGKQIEGDNWEEWVDSLPDVEVEDREVLKELTPDTYVGIGPLLTQLGIEFIENSREN